MPVTTPLVGLALWVPMTGAVGVSAIALIGTVMDSALLVEVPSVAVTVKVSVTGRAVAAPAPAWWGCSCRRRGGVDGHRALAGLGGRGVGQRQPGRVEQYAMARRWPAVSTTSYVLLVAGLAHDLVVTAKLSAVSGIVSAPNWHSIFGSGTRADRKIEHSPVAAERGLRLVNHKRRAAHALDAAGDHYFAFAAGYRLRRHDDHIKPAPAIALQYRAGDLDRQPCEQPGMPRDAAAILAGLIGAADDDILDLFRVERALLDDLGNDRGQHVVGPHRARAPAWRPRVRRAL